MSEDQPILPYNERLRLIKLGRLPKEAVAKKRKPINKVSEKKRKEMQEAKDEAGDTELVRWFRGRIKVMGKNCCECGMKVETGIYQYAIMHIAHLLEKRSNMFPSTRFHPLNFITLCVDHHHYYDNVGWEDREKMAIWPLVYERLVMIFPSIDPIELRHFPTWLRDKLEKDNKQ